MADIRQVLRQWYTVLAKHKDLLKKAIVSITESERGLLVQEQAVKREVCIAPSLTPEALKLQCDVIVTLNTRENLDFIISSWASLSASELLIIYVANPYSLTEKYWAIRPFVHERITERRALRKGLEALFSTVETYTEV